MMPYSKDLYRWLYSSMVTIRTCEESFVEPIVNGEIHCPVHLYSGEEAIAVGVCANLNQADIVFGTHRSHGHFLAKGGNLKSLVAEVFCKETGCVRGRGGSMHLIEPDIGFLGAAPIVAGTISLALGAALAIQIQEREDVAVAFFGDGAAGEGVLYEAMNFAAIHKLPLIFVCENNYYSTHMPIREIRTKDTIYETGTSFGIKSYWEDGNDVIKVYEKAKDAVAHCRGGAGPVFLEFSTYRLRGHVGPDDNIQGSHTDIRPPEEIEEWKKRDPIKNFRGYLVKENILTEDELRKIDANITLEVDEAHKWTKKSSNPRAEELANYVFK